MIYICFLFCGICSYYGNDSSCADEVIEFTAVATDICIANSVSSSNSSQNISSFEEFCDEIGYTVISFSDTDTCSGPSYNSSFSHTCSYMSNSVSSTRRLSDYFSSEASDSKQSKLNSLSGNTQAYYNNYYYYSPEGFAKTSCVMIIPSSEPTEYPSFFPSVASIVSLTPSIQPSTAPSAQPLSTSSINPTMAMNHTYYYDDVYGNSTYYYGNNTYYDDIFDDDYVPVDDDSLQGYVYFQYYQSSDCSGSIMYSSGVVAGSCLSDDGLTSYRITFSQGEIFIDMMLSLFFLF